MLTAKTFTGNQLSNLATAPHPSLTLKDADDSPGRVAPSVLVKEVEKLEAELKTFIERAYPHSQGDVRPRDLKRLKANVQKRVRDFLVLAMMEMLDSSLGVEERAKAIVSGFEDNKTMKTILRKCKHIVATIEADKPWLVREEARDLTRYVRRCSQLSQAKAVLITERSPARANR